MEAENVVFAITDIAKEGYFLRINPSQGKEWYCCISHEIKDGCGVKGDSLLSCLQQILSFIASQES